MVPAREVDCVAIWDSQSLDAPFSEWSPGANDRLDGLALIHPPLH